MNFSALINTAKHVTPVFICMIFSITVCLPIAHGDVLYVRSGAANGGDGSSWNAAYPDLQSAVDGAVEGDEIWVANGAYFPTVEHGGAGERYRSFQMKNGVSVIGGFEGDETSKVERSPSYNRTVLSGDVGVAQDSSDNCYHVFYHPSEIGLISSAVLENVTITGGNADKENGYPHDCGGGMLNRNSSPTLRNCVFLDNKALVVGGGIDNAFTSSPSLINCTLVDNTAGSSGGALSNTSGSSPVLTNCIVWGNSAENNSQVHNTTETGNSPLFSFSDIQGSGGSSAWAEQLGEDQGNNIDSDPLFVDLANGDLHLTHGSPCIDAGDNTVYSLLTGVDMDGEDRFTDSDGDRNPTVDMGADEFITSDEDTLSDYEEVMIYHTDKDLADSDGDGLTDSREVTLWGDRWDDDPDGDSLINILDPDSDNNGKNDSESDFKKKDDGGGCFIQSL